MLSQPRLDEIMRRLRQDRRVSVAELAGDLHVSDETVRRDLKLLEEQGKLRRIHGGAILPRLTEEQPIDVRARIKQREKARTAQRALALVQEGMSIFLDTGTTTLALAQRLGQVREVSVVTNSLDVARVVLDSSENRVAVLPGTVRRNDNAIIGYGALEWAQRFYYDLAFLGIAAIDLEQGFMDYEEDEAALRQVLIRQSHRSVVLADDSKFGRKAYVRTAALSDVATLVTNRQPPEPYVVRLRQAGVELLHD